MIETKNKIDKRVIETEIPMGLVHSAAMEPYRVRLFVEDEIVRDAEVTIGVNHRGIERLMEGLPVEKANSLTEKICGICSNIHIWNSCLTAEKGLEIDVPPRAEYIRIIMAEMERLHSHMLYLAHGSEVLGHETFAMRVLYIRETVMELLRMVGGNRVHYGVSVIGGVRPRCDLNEMRIQKISEGMDFIEEKITEFADRFIKDPMVMSRVTGVAALKKEDALRLAATGPTLRSTGIEIDLRTDMKEYEPFEFDVITQDDGDVKSNILMRVLEIPEAIKIVRQAIKDLPEGKVTNRSWEMQNTGIIRSYIEASRGKLYHSYKIEDGKLRNSIVRTPSMTNINAMEHACIGTHITDAQLAIIQCDPCFTCTDRAVQIINL